jgi:hypothetical protein
MRIQPVERIFLHARERKDVAAFGPSLTLLFRARNVDCAACYTVGLLKQVADVGAQAE